MITLSKDQHDSIQYGEQPPTLGEEGCSQQNEEHNYVLAKLLQIIAKSNTLEELIEGAASLFKCPLHVLDASYKVLASANYSNLGDELFIKSELLGYMADEQLEDAIQKHDSNLTSNKKAGYFIYKHGDTNYPMLVCYMLDGNTLAGYLGMLCVNGQPTETLASQVLLLASVISKHFMNTTEANKQRESVVTKDLLISLIEEGNTASSEIIKNRAIGLGLADFKGVYGLINVSCYDSPLEAISTVQNIFPGSTTFYYRHQIVVFIARQNQNKFVLTEYENERLQTLLDRTNLWACVSETFCSLGELRTIFYKGEDVLQVCGAFARTHDFSDVKSEPIANAFLDKRIYCTRNIVFLLSIYRAAKEISNGDMRRFIRRDVLAMYESDCAHDTDLVNTLFVYLDSKQSFIRAANRLYCHKNTVIYRIDRIRSLYELDFSDASVVVDLYLSLALLAIFNRIESIGPDRYFWKPREN